MSLADVKRRAIRPGRRWVVAVIGSGWHPDAACPALGHLIATLGYDLLTGGGRGVMEAVSRAFYETEPRRGIVVGVIPARVDALERLERREPTAVAFDPPPGYPNEWVELAIYTHLPDSGADGTRRSSRNHVNVLSADAIVALPGGEGTWSEMWLATQYGVPTVAYGEHQGDLPSPIARARTLEDVRRFLTQSVASV